MKLKLTEIADYNGSIHMNFPVKEVCLEGIVPVSTDIEMKINVQKSEPNFNITGSADLIIRETCDRCLDSFNQSITAPFSILVTYQKSLITGYFDSDIHLLDNNQKDIDLKPTVQDAILLERSMKHLCREDCSGLCPHCGINLNYDQCNCESKAIDERWAPLMDINFPNQE